MKVLGIVGSPRSSEESGTYAVVKKVLEATGLVHEVLHLRGKTINGCIACLGCVKDNICVVDDDMGQMREKILEADAYVIGAPNYYTALNGITHCFLERLYQFRHQTGNALWGKLAVAVGVGGSNGMPPCDDIEKFMLYNFIETVAKVSGQGAASCFTCGYGDTCEVGVPAMMFGKGVRYTEDMIPGVHKDPAVFANAEKAGRLLGARLTSGHDRTAVTGRMQEIMMAKFKEST